MVRCRDGQKSSLRVGGTNLALIGFEQRQIYFGMLLMQKLLISAAALYVSLGVAIAQPAATPGNQPLSLDQQSKISEIITNQTPQPLTGTNFSIAPGVVVPPDVALQRLPVAAEKVAPQLQGDSYLAVEELVAIVGTNSRKISSVMQRMRRQENSQSGQ
jgi:hypothetical protein